MAVHNLLRATEAGLGDGETPIFPVQIFKVKEGVNYNEGDPNYDLFRHALRCSAKRLFPNFSFLDAPFNLQYYKAGDPEQRRWRTWAAARAWWANAFDPSQRGHGCGSGNLCASRPSTCRGIGIVAQRRPRGRSIRCLDEMLDARGRHSCCERLRDPVPPPACAIIPFLMGQGVWIDSEKLDRNDSVAEVLKHGTLSVGFIGLAET